MTASMTLVKQDARARMASPILSAAQKPRPFLQLWMEIPSVCPSVRPIRLVGAGDQVAREPRTVRPNSIPLRAK